MATPRVRDPNSSAAAASEEGRGQQARRALPLIAFSGGRVANFDHSKMCPFIVCRLGDAGTLALDRLLHGETPGPSDDPIRRAHRHRSGLLPSYAPPTPDRTGPAPAATRSKKIH
jgi:hypothetical protein